MNSNLNSGKSKAEIEQALSDFLGVTDILWLGDGIEGDDTDGHIDDICRFVDRTTVLAAVEEDPEDPNFQPLQANLALIKSLKAKAQPALNVLTLPMPPRIEREGRRLPASYANFYIANKVVLLPVFCSPRDKRAYETLQECCPDRRIVPIDCRELIWGLGAFHCLTQQQPAL